MAKVALLALLLPAALAGCLGGDSGAPVPTGQIDGAVVDHLLRPFGSQDVYLSPLGWRDSTSRLGGFTFREVPVGSYTLLTAREGTLGAAAVVEVQEDRITKVILQMLPVPAALPTMSILPRSSHSDYAFPGEACLACTWTIPLDDAPAEVVFEAHWDATTLGMDSMRFRVTDDRGDVLYQSPVETDGPVTISISGDDIPDEARSLQVTASFGRDFTPRPSFRLDTVLTLYHGATKAELFGQ